MRHFVIPVGFPRWDVNTLASVIAEYIGENPLDASRKINRSFSVDAEVLSVLMAFKGSSLDALGNIRNSEPVQVHFKYNFLVFCSRDAWNEIAQLNLGLGITYSEDTRAYLSIISGDLSDWQRAVVIGTNHKDSSEVVSIFNMIYLEFEKLGLSEIWSEYKRVAGPDRTFHLEG